jgi:hypothetical protein
VGASGIKADHGTRGIEGNHGGQGLEGDQGGPGELELFENMCEKFDQQISKQFAFGSLAPLPTKANMESLNFCFRRYGIDSVSLVTARSAEGRMNGSNAVSPEAGTLGAF